MHRGTTPTLNFTIPFDTSAVGSLSIAFAQDEKIIFEKTKLDCKLEDDTIKVKLSQYDTLLFNAKQLVRIQLRVKTTDGNALASEIIKVSVGEILKDGEI